MADESPIRDSNDDKAGIPRWVYVLGIITLVVIVLFVILHFSFSGPMDHGTQQP